MKPFLLTVFFCLILHPTTSNARQILLRYADIGDNASTRAMAADKAGNLFVVSSVVDDAGVSLVRINKLDPSGKSVASFDFGGAYQQPAAAAMDADGNIIVVGVASSAGFPLVSPLFSSVSSSCGFIVKIDSNLTRIHFSTLVNGPGVTDVSSVAAVTTDSKGNIYIAGSTGSSDFPATPGTYHTAPALPFPGSGGFLMEISPDGAQLLYSGLFAGKVWSCQGGSSCVGSTARASVTAIAVDSSGGIVFAGNTNTLDLPVTPGAFGGSCACTNTGAGFIAKLTPGGAQLAWATYVNPPQPLFYQWLSIDSLALDSAGNVLIGGAAPSFPTTTGSPQPAAPTNAEFKGFLAKFNSTGTQILWATYMGGHVSAQALSVSVTGISVAPTGEVLFTGYSDADLLPAFPGASLFGNTYVGRISGDGSALVSLYVGADGATGQSLVLTPSGNFVTAGQRGSIWVENSGNGPSLLTVGNAASGPVSGYVAPYEIVSVCGLAVGPPTPLVGQVVNNAFTSSLGGYSLTFDGTPAPLLYIGPTQINVIVPAEVTGRESTHVEFVTPSGQVDGPTLTLRAAQPGIFQSSTGQPGSPGQSAALNQDGSINSPANPAKPGSVVTIFATAGDQYRRWGDGQIVPANLAKPEIAPVAVFGGPLAGPSQSSLEVDYAGDAPALVAGAMQINFRTPQSFNPLDPFVIALEVAGVRSGTAAISIAQQ